MGADRTANLPGINEIDVLVGEQGADVFVLGDGGKTFYVDDDLQSDGISDYALVWDFQSGTDRAQLAGSASDYELRTTDVNLPGNTAIYRLEPAGKDELIGVVNGDVPDFFASSDFIYDLIL